MRLRSARRRMKKMQWIICLPVALASACFILYTTSSSSMFHSSSSSSSSYSSHKDDREKQSDVRGPAPSANRLKMSAAAARQDVHEGAKDGRMRSQVMVERLPPSTPPSPQLPPQLPPQPPSSSSAQPPLNNPGMEGAGSHRVPAEASDRYGRYRRRPRTANNKALGQMKFPRQQTFVVGGGGVEPSSRSGIIVRAAAVVDDDDARAGAAAVEGEGEDGGVRAQAVNEPNGIVFGREEGRGMSDGGKTSEDNESIQLAASSTEIAPQTQFPLYPPPHWSPRQPAPPLFISPSVPSSSHGGNHMLTAERNNGRNSTVEKSPLVSHSSSANSSTSSASSGDIPADANPCDYGHKASSRRSGQEGAGKREENDWKWKNEASSKEVGDRLRKAASREEGHEEGLTRRMISVGRRTRTAASKVDKRTVQRGEDGLDTKCPHDDSSRGRSKTGGGVFTPVSGAGKVTRAEAPRNVASHGPCLDRSSTETETDSALLKKRTTPGWQEGNGGERSGDVRTIPRIIHQTSDYATVPGQVVEWMKSWLRHNPSYEYWFWTDSGTRHVLSEDYPPWIASLYDAYPYAINQADIRKFLILYLHGGVYADLDTECLRSLDPLLDDPEAPGCILGLEPEIHRLFLYPNGDDDRGRDYVTSSFIACRPRHPFLDFVIRQLPDYFNNSRTLAWNDNILNSTGPTFLTEVVHKYLNGDGGQGQGRGPETDIFIAPSEWLVPTFDPINLDRFKVLCKVKGIVSRDGRGVLPPLPKICDKLASNAFLNVPEADSYTNHHWLHSWGINFIPHGFTPVQTLINLTRLIT